MADESISQGEHFAISESPFRRTPVFFGEAQSSVPNRIIAKLIDAIVVVTIYFAGRIFWEPVGIFVATTYCALSDSLGMGQSIGKKIIGLRVIEDSYGVSCGAAQSCLRNLPFALSFILCVMSMFWVLLLLIGVPLLALELYLLFSLPTGIRIGDVIGNTVVIEAVDI